MSQRIVTSQPTWTADIYRNYGLFAVYNGYALPTDYSSFRSNPYIPTAVQINPQNLRPTRVLYRYGSAWHLSSSGSRHVVDVAAPTQCYGLSVLMVLNPRGAIVWNDTQHLYKSSGSGGSLLNYNYSTKVLGGAIREGGYDTPTPVIATTSVDLTNGGILIHRWNAGSSTYVTWFNGQELTQSYSSSGTPSFAKSDGVFRIGEYGTYNDLMPLALFAAADRYWDDATASKLTLNPWQIFRPQSARIYSFSTGAAAYSLAAASGAYSYTGTASSVHADRLLAGSSGSYAYTGAASELTLSRVIAVASGSYAYTGTAADTIAARIIAAASGSYSYTGTEADIIYTPIGGYTIACDAGAYSYTGTAAALQVARTIAPESGAYSYSGTGADVVRGFVLDAGNGTYVVTGEAAALLRDAILASGSGAYTYTGTDMTLTYSGATVILSPGLEFTAPTAREHFTAPTAREHYTVPLN